MELFAFGVALLVLAVLFVKLFLVPPAPDAFHRAVSVQAGDLVALARQELADRRVKALEEAEAAVRHREVLHEQAVAKLAVQASQLNLDRKSVDLGAKAVTAHAKHVRHFLDAELKVALQEKLDGEAADAAERIANEAAQASNVSFEEVEDELEDLELVDADPNDLASDLPADHLLEDFDQ